MIVTGDIETILVRDLKPFGIPTYKKDAIPEGEVTEERITVIPKEPKPGTYWIKGFVNLVFIRFSKCTGVILIIPIILSVLNSILSYLNHRFFGLFIELIKGRINI